MQIRRIDTEQKRDVKQFVAFPFELYRDCALWVPPLVSSVKNELNRRKHPFYHYSTAGFFVAESEGQTVGRIAVMHNRNYNEYRKAKAAFFGYFEVAEDIEIARALFDAAFDWARAEGLEEIIGPKGLSGIEGGSVLVEGFEYPPAMGVPYNFPYYDTFIKDSGFDKDTDYLSGYLDGDYQLPERFFEIAEKVKARSGFWIKAFRSRREMRQWVPRVIRVHQEAFSQNYTFYPPTDEEIALIVDLLIKIADLRLVKFVMKDEKIVGFIFAYPDLSDGLRKVEGRLWPFGWYTLLQERKRSRRINLNGLGLLPGYRGLGANAVLYTELYNTLRPLDFEHIEAIQVEEGNSKSLAEFETAGVNLYKRHRSYRRAL